MELAPFAVFGWLLTLWLSYCIGRHSQTGMKNARTARTSNTEPRYAMPEGGYLVAPTDNSPDREAGRIGDSKDRKCDECGKPSTAGLCPDCKSDVAMH